MKDLVTSLWFDDEAEEAANFYVSLFPNSRVTRVTHYGSAGPRPEGMVMTVDFELNGRPFNTLNGGPDFKFTEATSIIVNCESQEEVDRLWDAFGEGGEPGPCGWIKDRFGLSWQVTPTRLDEMLTDADAGKAQAAMAAMLRMGKIEIAELEEAFNKAA